MEQEDLKEVTTIDMSRQTVVTEADTADMTITDGIEEDAPDAAIVGFDDGSEGENEEGE